MTDLSDVAQKVGRYVTHTTLWGTVTFVVVAILTLVGVAFSWHKEQPHEGALEKVHLVGLIKDTQHLKEDVMYLRVKLDEVNGKLDLLLTR